MELNWKSVRQGKLTNTWKLNGTSKQSLGDIGVFFKYIKLNENEISTFYNMWDAAKAVLREKFIAQNAYIRKVGESQNQ